MLRCIQPCHPGECNDSIGWSIFLRRFKKAFLVVILHDLRKQPLRFTEPGDLFGSTIFAMSIFSSLSSLVGLWPPTADVSTTLAWGIVVFVIITFTKLKTNGLLGYLKGFCDPIFVMAPFNVLGEVFTPISMAFRHFGNIVSGTVISTLVYAALVVANHALFSIIPGVVGQWLGAIPFLTVGIPAIISLYFDWFGSFMQAFIFCMLTMMFISTAAE